MQGICGPTCLLTAVPADLLVVLVCLFSFWLCSLKAYYKYIKIGSTEVFHLCTCFSSLCGIRVYFSLSLLTFHRLG